MFVVGWDFGLSEKEEVGVLTGAEDRGFVF